MGRKRAGREGCVPGGRADGCTRETLYVSLFLVPQYHGTFMCEHTRDLFCFVKLASESECRHVSRGSPLLPSCERLAARFWLAHASPQEVSALSAFRLLFEGGRGVLLSGHPSQVSRAFGETERPFRGSYLQSSDDDIPYVCACVYTDYRDDASRDGDSADVLTWHKNERHACSSHRTAATVLSLSSSASKVPAFEPTRRAKGFVIARDRT